METNLSTVSDAIDQIRTGVDGWKNTLVRRGDVELIAAERIAVCDACEHQSGLTCGICGCPLVAKTRAREATCPDGRW